MSVEVKAQNTISMTSVKAIKDASDEANTLLAGMRQSALDAGTTLNGIYQDAEDAKTSADSAQASADSASEYASRALGNLATVQNITETLNWITAHGTMTLTTDTALDPTHVYFVVDAQGDYVVGGTHYAIVTEPNIADISTYYELSINESLNNYVATHLAVDSEGLWIIPDAGGNKVLIATGNGSTYTTAGTYIIGKVNGADTVLAKFLSSGATIMAENGTQVAHLGYGLGYNSGGQLVNAPFYTLGTRKANSAVGNYSHAEGVRTTASGVCSHAEGDETEASGAYAHAEGLLTVASGTYAHAEGANSIASSDYSHAEGSGTEANGVQSHAEGGSTVADGDFSHAQNFSTTASSDYQTALGRYNIDDTADKYAVIIGNGTSYSAPRSNALAVTWDGNVEIDLADYQTASTTDKAIYDALVSLGWDSEVLV